MNEKHSTKHYMCTFLAGERLRENMSFCAYKSFNSTEPLTINYDKVAYEMYVLYFLSLMINFKISLPLSVSSYVVDGGLSVDTVLEISPVVSSSFSRLAIVRLLVFGINDSSSSLNRFGPLRSSKRISSPPFFAIVFSNFCSHSIYSIVLA